MKITSKFACLMLTLVMVLAMVVPAMAAGTETPDPDSGVTTEKGKITISNAVVGQTYTIYQILYLESYNQPAAGADGQIPEGQYAYKATTAWKDFINSTEIKGVYVDVDGNGYVTWHENADVAEFAKKALDYAETLAANQGSKEATEANVVFEGINLGYYLVNTTLGTICSLDTTNPNVTIEEKNVVPTIEKLVQEDSKIGMTDEWGNSNTAQIGQDVNFKLTVGAKSGAQNYVVHDKMPDGLTFAGLDQIVYGSENTPLTGKSDTVTAPYSSTNPSGYCYELVTSDLETDTPCAFHIKFVQDWLDTISADTNIVITYSATLNGSAVTTTEGNVNTAWLSYNGGETAKVSTKTSTYEFDLVKTDSDANGKNVLTGAQFELYASNADGATPIELVKLNDGRYRVKTNNENAGAEITTTIDAGKATIVGLDADKYYLKETKQPKGYNILNGFTEVTITGNMSATVTDGIWTEGGVRIINQTGAELPSTGGIGTTIFYVVGGVLLVGAGVLLVVRKRMSMTKESD